MEVNPVVVALAGFSRTFFGLSTQDAGLVAQKAFDLGVELGVSNVSDLLDLLDDVWGASLSEGLISESSLNVPEHPLSAKERHWNSIDTEEQRHLASQIPDDAWPKEAPKPKRYRNKRYMVQRRERARKRRWWDKDV